MDFMIRTDAKQWFRDVRGNKAWEFQLDFDAFYCCFIAGVAMLRKRDVPHAEASGMVEYFPGEYGRRSRLLVALFLRHELEYMGVTLQEKGAVREQIARLIQPNARHFLTDEGVREFNKYAHGGFDVLQDWFGGEPDRPRSLETFLRAFHRKLEDTGGSVAGTGS